MEPTAQCKGGRAKRRAGPSSEARRSPPPDLVSAPTRRADPIAMQLAAGGGKGRDAELGPEAQAVAGGRH